MTTPSPNLYLMSALNFGPDDLEANRSGAVGPRQEAFHQHQAARMRKGMMSFMAFLPVLGVYALVQEASRGRSINPLDYIANFQPAYLIPIAVLAVYIGVMLYLIFFWKTTIADKRVQQAEGPVELKLAGEGGANARLVQARTGLDPMRGRLKVGGKTFIVSEGVLRAFKPGGVYRVYYVRHGLGGAVGAQSQVIGAELVADAA